MPIEPRRRPVVLVLLAHYLPGYKSGGPIRSIANLVEALGDRLDFRIVTSNRDAGEATPFAVETGCWTAVGKAQVCYVPDTLRGLWTFGRTLLATRADVVYLNSFFARRYSMLPVLLRRLGVLRAPVVLLAPRGEFSPGALIIKSRRKRLYVALARWVGLWRGVVWHATTDWEERDIRNAAGPEMRVLKATEMPGAVRDGEDRERRAKAAGCLRLVFLSRVSPKKNLEGALRMLREVRGRVRFDIYGPVEDRAYWKACQERMAELPPNVVARYCGVAPHEAVHDVLADHDALLFATHGENYGHVIREAFSAGCPVIVSDQTPWRGLQDLGIGWDLPLENEGAFRAAIQKCVDMSAEEFAAWSARARDYGESVCRDAQIARQNERLFAAALELAHAS